MDVDRRHRFAARFARGARARRAQIQARLRFSAVSNKVTLLDAGVRAYGSPLLRRRKGDVERDTELALSYMSPYPGTTCDMLDDVDDLGGAASIPVDAVSGATARRSRFAAPLRSKAHVLDPAPQTTWPVNARQFREPTPPLPVSQAAFSGARQRERHGRQEEEKDGEALYSNRTKSLILRTNKRLYDAPSGLYMDMTKRALGYAPLQESDGRDGGDGGDGGREGRNGWERGTRGAGSAHSVGGGSSANRRSNPTFLRRMAEATAAAVAAEAAQEDRERAAESSGDSDDRGDGASLGEGNAGVARTQGRRSRGECKETAAENAGQTNNTASDTSILGYGLSFGDLNLTVDGKSGVVEAMGGGGGRHRRDLDLHRVEEEVDDWEEDNAAYVDLLLGDLPKWIKGPPVVHVSGAKISSRVHAWRDEARVQGENASRMLEMHENKHAVSASMYRSRAVAEDAATISSADSFAAEKGSGNALSASIAPAVLGKSRVELESPGVILLPQKRPLVMGAASLCSYYDEDNLAAGVRSGGGGLASQHSLYNASGGGSSGGSRGAAGIRSSGGHTLQKSKWEMMSEANAIVFHEAVAEPSQQRDTSRRFDFTHHQNKRRIGKARKAGTFLR